MFKLLSILALLVGPVLLAVDFISFRKNQEVDRVGVETTAVATSKTQFGKKDGYAHTLEITYSLKNGKMVSKEVMISKALHQKIDAQPTIKVKYHPEFPGRVIIVGEPLVEAGDVAKGIVVTLGGLFGVWWFFIRKKPAAEVVPVEG